jgi:predicted amidohydrolase YtcJ
MLDRKRIMSDLILTNANVITMNQASPRAQLIATRDGRILAVGRNEDLSRLKKQGAEVIDCKRKTVLPGFIDCHCHLLAFAEGLVTLDLTPAKSIRSIADIQATIRRESRDAAPGMWIKGKGYNEFYLTEKRHPSRWDLDVATTVHPIKLTHRSSRAHVLNSLALKLVGISNETADPPEGLIDRDIETGEPTGLLYGMGDYLAKSIPPIGPEQLEHGIKLASRQLSCLGITSIHDASPRNNLERWGMFQRWIAEGHLQQRATLLLGYEGFKAYRKHAFSSSIADDQLRVGGVKIIVHETTGQLSPSRKQLNEMVSEVHEAGLQAVLHAIEGKAVEAACDAIEYTLERSHRSDHRHRIEHCSVCPESLARRIASLGIRVVTQPSFIYYNGERYRRTVPDENLKCLYPIATLMKNGVKAIGSSDFPIVPPNPVMGIYAAVSRKAENGDVVLPEESISALEAVRMYTYYAAEVSYEETIKGSIMPGRLADLVVLSDDPTKLPPDEIKEIQVEVTILKGKIVWNGMG